MLRGWPSAEHPSCRVSPLTLKRILWLRKRRRRRRRRRRRPRRQRRRSNEASYSFARVEFAPPGLRVGREIEGGGRKARFFYWLEKLALRERELGAERGEAGGKAPAQPGHDARARDDALAHRGCAEAIDHEHRKRHRHEDAAQFQHPR